jgi:transposase
VATVFEVRDELGEVVEPMIPPVKVPERQGRRPVVGRMCFDTASG